MPTNNRRVAAYLPDRVATHFKAFQSARGLGDSKALIEILEAFFELGQDNPSARSLIARVERLERIIGDADEF